MLFQWTLAILCFIDNVAQVGSRPPSPPNDWEVGRPPTSGLDIAGVWLHGPSRSSGHEESSLRSSEDPTGHPSWYPTWRGSRSNYDHGDVHQLPADWSNYYDRATEPAAVPKLEASVPGHEVAETSFQTQASSHEHWPADHEDPDPTLQRASSSGHTTEHTPLFQMPAVDRVTKAPRTRRKMRKLEYIIDEASHPEPSRPGPVHLSALDKYKATKDEWEQRMRTTLRSKSIASAEDEQGRLFIASGGGSARNSRPPHSADSVIWEYRTSNGRDASPTSKSAGDPDKRMIVYLNSPNDMKRLNKEYFHNALRILPIQLEALDWRELVRMHLRERISYVLPPKEDQHLPVILNRHDGSKGRPNSYLMKLTGQEKVGRSFSLWSPVLHDGVYSTMVLYGVGELLHQEKPKALYEQLAKKLASYKDSPFHHAFHLAEEIHRL